MSNLTKTIVGGKKVLKMTKAVILFLIPLLLISSVIAENFESDFEIELRPVNNIVFEDEVAEFNLTIINNADFEESFMTPYTSDIDWIITTDPELSRVPRKSNATFKLFLDPKTNVIPGQYGTTINLRSTLSEKVRSALAIAFLKPLNPLPQGYTSSIALNVEVPTRIDPREEVTIKVYLRNRNAREYPNLTIKINSSLIKKEYQTSFAALEENTEEFTFTLDAYTIPQEDRIIVTLSDGSELINQVKVPIRIIPYTEIRETRDVERGFLKTTTKITLTNFGNVENNKSYEYPVGFFESFVTFTTPGSSVITRNDDKFVEFEMNLGPGDWTTIEIETNYRAIFYTLILIIIAIVLYFRLRSEVVVKKEAMANQPSHDGVSEFKFKVLIKNRSQKPVENVKIIESIPSLAEIIRETAVGTMEPSKVIRNDMHGTLIRWDINYLEPFEERIITYKIKSKLNIVGGLTLPPTKVKFETVTGRERVTYSRKTKVVLYN